MLSAEENVRAVFSVKLALDGARTVGRPTMFRVTAVEDALLSARFLIEADSESEPK